MFFIDIDNVLARDTIGYSTYMNRYFQLGIGTSVIESLTRGYAEFIELEEVRSFIRSNGLVEKFNRVAKEAQFAALVQELREPIDGAVEAVNRIAKRHNVRYVTCRKASTIEVTQSWLDRYGFPEPEQVTCCEALHLKYLAGYQMAGEDESLIFIDDMAKQLMSSWVHLVKHHYEKAKIIRKRSLLLAFGHTEAPAWPFKKPLHPVKALPNWSQFDAVMSTGELLVQ